MPKLSNPKAYTFNHYASLPLCIDYRKGEKKKKKLWKWNFIARNKLWIQTIGYGVR